MYRYWLWLALLPKMSHGDKLSMLRRSGDPELLYRGDRSFLSALSPEEKCWGPLLDKNMDRALAVLAQCDQLGIGLLPLDHPDYPAALGGIPNPPLLLYCRGTVPDTRKLPLVGVVGTRNCSDYGLRVARELSAQLGAHGAGVVSGMAAGIDTAALEGVLRSRAPGVGVLGCGLDVVFPKSNQQLYRQVERQGCLLSEYPPGTPPARWNFPWRNRIISGMSGAVVVVEAPEKSGALITARDAIKQGREVYAVPGPVGESACAGSNQLLREGAQMATDAWDILRGQVCRYPWLRPTGDRLGAPSPEEKPSVAPSRKPQPRSAPVPEEKPQASAPPEPRPVPGDLSPEEQKVYACLGPEKRHVNTLAAETGLTTAAVLFALTMLEIKGAVIVQPGGWAITSNNH